MKKQWVIFCSLVLLEQSIKLIIWTFARNVTVTIIPGIFRFEPFQNTNLNWIASMAGVTMPVLFMVIFQVFAGTALLLFYRYQRHCNNAPAGFLHSFFCFALAGVTCSFCDVVFWGGSVDYIGFLNWFIFDLKDVYLHVGWISLVIWLIRGGSKETDNAPTFRQWLFSRGKD